MPMQATVRSAIHCLALHFRSPPPANRVKDEVHFRCMSEQADVIKKHTCTACGTEDVMRFHLREPLMVALCSRCGAVVQLKQETADGRYPQSAFDDRPEWSHSAPYEEALADSSYHY